MNAYLLRPEFGPQSSELSAQIGAKVLYVGAYVSHRFCAVISACVQTLGVQTPNHFASGKLSVCRKILPSHLTPSPFLLHFPFFFSLLPYLYFLLFLLWTVSNMFTGNGIKIFTGAFAIDE